MRLLSTLKLIASFPLKIIGWKMKCPVGSWPIFRFHVKLQGHIFPWGCQNMVAVGKYAFDFYVLWRELHCCSLFTHCYSFEAWPLISIWWDQEDSFFADLFFLIKSTIHLGLESICPLFWGLQPFKRRPKFHTLDIQTPPELWNPQNIPIQLRSPQEVFGLDVLEEKRPGFRTTWMSQEVWIKG